MIKLKNKAKENLKKMVTKQMILMKKSLFTQKIRKMKNRRPKKLMVLIRRRILHNISI